jgi:adenylosuccinate lyase
MEINFLNVEKNLSLTGGFIMTERIMQRLVEKGMKREDAYDILREIVHTSLKRKKSFRTLLLCDSRIIKLIDKNEINSLLDPHTYIGMASEIIDRTLKIIKPNKIKNLKKLSYYNYIKDSLNNN